MNNDSVFRYNGIYYRINTDIFKCNPAGYFRFKDIKFFGKSTSIVNKNKNAKIIYLPIGGDFSREDLIERISNRSSNPENKYYKILEIVLMEKNPKEILSKSGVVKPTAHFPIQSDTCSIVENASGVGLCFDRRAFLMSCIGKERLDRLNSNYKKVQKTLDDIESVLGKVPVVEKLRDELKEYQVAISKFFDYTNEE